MLRIEQFFNTEGQRRKGQRRKCYDLSQDNLSQDDLSGCARPHDIVSQVSVVK